MSDFSADRVEFIDANDKGVFSEFVNKAEHSSFTLGRSFACALALGLTFWFALGYLIWGH